MRLQHPFQRLLLVCVASASLSSLAQNFTNPVQHYADPFVIYSNGYYYSTGTIGTAIQIWRSDTIPGLLAATPTTVFTPKGGTANCCGLWSPELHNIGGKWFIYYTADNGSGTKYDFVLQGGSDPLGSYSDIGQIDCGQSCDDPHVFQDVTTGRWYFLFAGLNPRNIGIQQLNTDGHSLIGSRSIIVTPNGGFDCGIVEGPRVLQNAGKTYLTFAVCDAAQPYYKTGMTVTTGTDFLNPSAWSENPNPVFQAYSGPNGNVYGPARLTFTTSRDGTEHWMLYHAKLDNGVDYNRDTRAQKFTFNSDGSPNFGAPIPSGVLQNSPSGDLSAGPAPVSGTTYKLTNLNSGLVLDDQGGSNTPGANVQQWTNNDLPPQRWTFTDVGSSYFKLINKQANLAMDDAGGSTAAGANVQLWTDNGLAPQHWQFFYWGNGYYKVVNQQSGLPLDVASGSTTAGGNVQLWYDNGLAPQRWKLEPK